MRDLHELVFDFLPIKQTIVIRMLFLTKKLARYNKILGTILPQDLCICIL
jgi:hypothetical protein